MTTLQHPLPDNQKDSLDVEPIVLTDVFKKLGEQIRSEVQQSLQREKVLQVSRYHQHLLTQLPNHMLVKMQAHLGSSSLPLVANSQFNVLDAYKPQDQAARYSTQNLVQLSAFEVSEVSHQLSNMQVELESKAPLFVEQFSFDLWVNPELWSQFDYQLPRLKYALLNHAELTVTAQYEDGSEQPIPATLSALDGWTLACNDALFLRSTSPEFDLGMRLSFGKVPHQDKRVRVKSFKLLFGFDGEVLLSPALKTAQSPLLSTNIVPLFNLYEDLSVAMPLDFRQEQINLHHSNDIAARPFYVRQLFLNQNLYKPYHQLGESEFVFHRESAALLYTPNDIQQAVATKQKLSARIFWNQDKPLPQLPQISTAAINTQRAEFEVIKAAEAKHFYDINTLEQVGMTLQNFAQFQLGNREHFLFLAKHLLGSNENPTLQKFSSAIKEINFDPKSSELSITCSVLQHMDLVRTLSELIIEFIMVNTALVIRLLVSIA